MVKVITFNSYCVHQHLISFVTLTTIDKNCESGYNVFNVLYTNMLSKTLLGQPGVNSVPGSPNIVEIRTFNFVIIVQSFTYNIRCIY